MKIRQAQEAMAFIGLSILLLSCPQSTETPHADTVMTYKPSAPTDGSLALATKDPMDAARAIGANDGLVIAEWVMPDGSARTTDADYDLGHGMLAAFGNNVIPREGSRILALSSGTARQPTEMDYVATSFNKGYTSGCPAGYPVEYPPYPRSSSNAFDGIGLKLVMKMPIGVKGFAIDYRYYTHDYPDYHQSTYADQCAAIMSIASGTSTPMNILYNRSVSSAGGSSSPLGSACHGVLTCCDSGYDGTEDLEGTGFDSSAATTWITTSFTTKDALFVAQDQIEFVFSIWDSGDGLFDSTLLIDNFRWIPGD